MSDCPYTGTTVINKELWGDWPSNEPKSYSRDIVATESEASDTDSEEDSEEEIPIEEPATQENEENEEMAGMEEDLKTKDQEAQLDYSL